MGRERGTGVPGMESQKSSAGFPGSWATIWLQTKFSFWTWGGPHIVLVCGALSLSAPGRDIQPGLDATWVMGLDLEIVVSRGRCLSFWIQVINQLILQASGELLPPSWDNKWLSFRDLPASSRLQITSSLGTG